MGAQVVRAGYDPQTDAFFLVVEHESFEEMEEGAFIPERHITVRTNPK